MIFELSNDIVPILFCFTVFLSVFTVHLANSIVREYGVYHRMKAQREMQSVLSHSFAVDDVPEESLQQQNFLTRIVKRKEAPEDDGDYAFSSYHVGHEIIRGGLRWKLNLYSPALKSIVSY